MSEAGSMTGENEDRDTEQGKLRVRYHYDGPFVDVLSQMRCALLVSTYQAGKLFAISHSGDDLSLSFHGFGQAMGVAVRDGVIAVGTREEVCFLADSSQIAPLIEPANRFDRLYLHRASTVTGPIHGHDLAWSRDDQGFPEVWVVNTSFSCLCTLEDRFSFVPRWQPPFITELRAEDRCHLNGLGMRDGRPAVVTAMAQTDVARGWRENKNHTGLILDVASGEPVTVGMAMPHSPRFYNDRLFVLNSGHGTFESVDQRSGARTVIASVLGFTRGLALWGNLAFIGLSRIRETAVFGGVPLAARHTELRSGVAVVDLNSGNVVAQLEFDSGIEEIFDVQILPESTCVSLGGESPNTGDKAHIWITPGPETTRLD